MLASHFPSLQKHLGVSSATVGLVLGSGLGALGEQVVDAQTVAYADIPELGFDCSVKGHTGKLTVGKIGKTSVACLHGRAHWYESPKADIFLHLMRLLTSLGCEMVILTNAAGAINQSYQVGDVILLKDHINLQARNPLIGLKPVPFISMDNAYDSDLRNTMLNNAKSLGIELKQGVYCGVLGPSFETPAEIKSFGLMGADLVGMSTIPEVIAARYCGLKVMALSVVSNMAAGISDTPLSHALTLEGAARGTKQAIKLLGSFVESL